MHFQMGNKRHGKGDGMLLCKLNLMKCQNNQNNSILCLSFFMSYKNDLNREGSRIKGVLMIDRANPS